MTYAIFFLGMAKLPGPGKWPFKFHKMGLEERKWNLKGKWAQFPATSKPFFYFSVNYWLSDSISINFDLFPITFFLKIYVLMGIFVSN